MFQITAYLIPAAVGAAIVAFLIYWPKIAQALKYKPSAGTVGGYISVASDWTTDAVTAGAFTSLAASGWANDDLEFLSKLSELRAMQAKWVPATVPASPTIDTLAIQIASLQSQVASQATSTIPSAIQVQP